MSQIATTAIPPCRATTRDKDGALAVGWHPNLQVVRRLGEMGFI
jgi:hypothetical protein